MPDKWSVIINGSLLVKYVGSSLQKCKLIILQSGNDIAGEHR